MSSLLVKIIQFKYTNIETNGTICVKKTVVYLLQKK